MNKLKDLQEIWKSERPKAPDLWLIDKNKRHYFIEVKKDSDKPDEKQLLGLVLIEKYFNMPTFIIYLHPEHRKELSYKKKLKWLSDYNSKKTYVEHSLKK